MLTPFVNTKRYNFEVASTLLRRGGVTYLSRRVADGRWQNPGGKLEMGEAPRDGAQRELWEETGLLIPLDRFEPLGKTEVAGKSYCVHTFVVDLADDEVPAQVEKHKAGPWLAFTFAEILNLNTVSVLRDLANKPPPVPAGT